MLKKALLATATVVLFPLWLFAIEITLPAKVSGEENKPVYIESQTKGEIVKWVAIDKGLNLVDLSKLGVKNSKTAVAFGKNGKYRLMAYTSDAATGPSDPAFCVVEIGPPVPGPDPDPLPTPDQLKDVLQKAYDVSKTVDKKLKLQALTVVYKTASEDLPKVDTIGDLLTVLHNTADGLVGKGNLDEIRKALSDHFKKLLPVSPTTPLSEVNRTLCIGAFKDVASILESLKP